MGSSYTTLKYIANKYNDYPPGCVPCPKGDVPGNPGTFEDFHKNFNNLEPKNFEGVRMIVKKILSNHFYVQHNFAMTSKRPFNNEKIEDGYKFGASYTGIKRVGPRERYPMLYGDITPSGDLNANFIHTLGCRFRVKLSTEVIKNKYKNLKATTEYRSDDFTLSASLVDPALLKQEGILVLQFLQAITSRITLGAEIACNKSSMFPGELQTSIATAMRYSTGFRTLSTTLGKAGLRVCYHHIQSQHLQMGVELQINFNTHESKARLVSQIDVPSADLIFRAFADTNWTVGGVLEKKLHPIPEASLALSAILDHNTHCVNVGIGLYMG